MKLIGVLTALAIVPVLIIGMAFLGARVYAAGEIHVIDIVAFVIQILIIGASVFAAVVLWRRSSRQNRKQG